MLNWILHFYHDDPAWAWLTTVGLFAILLLGGFVIHRREVEARLWEEFRVQQDCKIVGRQAPSTFVAPQIGGKGGVSIGAIPERVGWLCRDGVTYWR